MQHNQAGFCSSLQEDWSVDELIVRKDAVTLRLSASVLVEAPSPMGRPGYLVMAEPRLFRETRTAEVHFRSVMLCQIMDELSAVTAMPEQADQEFAGSQFRCYSRSRLLTQQRSVRVDPEAAQIKHYQLVTGDEVIDVVSTAAPEVTIRHLL